MAGNDYKLSIYRRSPRPRSSRLREIGGSAATVVAGSSGISGDIISKLSLIDKFSSWFYEDEATGTIYVAKKNEQPRDFVSFGQVSAGGKGTGGDVPAGVTKLSALEDVSLADLSVGQVLQYDGEKWVNANAAGGISSLTINLGTVSYKGVGTTDVVVNLPAYPTSMAWGAITGKPTYYPADIENINGLNASWEALLQSAPAAYVTRWPAWGEVTGKPSWIGSTKPSYAFSEITGKPTTISGYGITDAYTKQTVDDKIAALQSAISAINSWFTLSDGTLITTYNIAADGEVSAGGQSSGGTGGGGLIQTVYGYSSLGGTFSDSNKNDTFNAYTINTLASRIGVLENTPSGISSLTVNVGTTSYVGTGTTDVTVNLPAYPTTLPASDVYAWAKQPNKPSYTFSEIGSKPSTLSGYGITDAYSKTDADGRYVKKSGDTMTGLLTAPAYYGNYLRDESASEFYIGSAENGITGYTGLLLATYGNLPTIISSNGTIRLLVNANGAYWNNQYPLLHSGNIGSFALTPSNYTSTLDSRYARLNTSVDFAIVDCESLNVYDSMSTLANRLCLNWNGSYARLYAVSNDGSLDQNLILGSTSAGRGLYYDASKGYWGIGTTAPAMKLHVVGTARFDDWIYSYNQRGWYNGTYGGGIYMTDSTYVRVYNGKAFYVANNIVATGQVSAGNASDRRLKSNITTLSEGETAHVLSHLNPVSFTWNAKAEELSGGDKKGIARSFVADEFLSLLPNAGRKMWNDYDAIYTEQVVPYLTKGWQMHERRLSDHERRIQELEKENRELKRQLRRVA